MQTVVWVDSIPGHYWQWRQQSIYYVRAGDRQAGRPPLLLIHGFGASTDHWRQTIQGLDDEFEVWAIDLLGFGRSAKPDWRYSAQLWQHQLHDFVTEVIGQPVVLTGNSLGGYAALCVASVYPEAAKGLILLNSAGPFSQETPAPQPSPIQQFIRSMVRLVLNQPWASFLLFKYVQQKSVIRQTLLKVYVDPAAVTDRLVDEIYRPSCDPGAPQVFASVFKSPPGQKIDALLQTLSCPLLMLWGEGDPWINARERGAQFRQYYPTLTEHYLKAGHCPHDEIPNQVNHLIQDWVKQL